MNSDVNSSNITIMPRKKSNTEALKPLIIKSKEHAALFKSKRVDMKIHEYSHSTAVDIKTSKKSIQKKSKYPLKLESRRNNGKNTLIFSSQEKARNTLLKR